MSLSGGQNPSTPLTPQSPINVKPREGRALAQVTRGIHERWLCPGPHPGLQTLRPAPIPTPSILEALLVGWGWEGRSPEGGARALFPGCTLPTSPAFWHRCAGETPHLLSGSSSRERSDPKGLPPSWTAGVTGGQRGVPGGRLCCCRSTSRGRWLRCSGRIPSARSRPLGRKFHRPTLPS